MSAPSRTYHLSPGRLLIFPLLWLVFAAPFVLVYFTGDHKLPPRSDGVLVLLAFLTLMFGGFFAIIWQSRLVVTAEGIAHHQLGYTVRSAWGNLAVLWTASVPELLLLDQPGTNSRLLRYSTRILQVFSPGLASGLFGAPNALAEGRIIFLAPFMSHWKRGPLREELLRHAPGLFDEHGVPKGNLLAKRQSS